MLDKQSGLLHSASPLDPSILTQGVLLVVGSAPCLFEDVKRALALYPTAAIMAVNGTCTCLPYIDYLLAGHTDKAEEFVAQREKAFPGTRYEVLATTDVKHEKESRQAHPSVTMWFDKTHCTGATSIGKGARMGLTLGYSPIIICGAPMDGSGYAEAEAKLKHNCHRVGDPTKQDHRVMKGYKEKFRKLSESESFRNKVFSMSGFTRDCLGEPPR